ncbi:hypothetical protein DRQ50_13540, partial [bacterium]
ANKEGELIIGDARLQAKRILEECRVRTEELRSELNGLRKEKETYLARFKSLAETQIQFVESHRSDFDDLDRRLIDMVDTAIAGVGAHAAPSAAELTSVPTAVPTAPAPIANLSVPRAPAWMNEAIPAAGTAPAAAAPAPVHNEVDQWRDYNPDESAASASAQAATAVQAATVVESPMAPIPTTEPVQDSHTPAATPWSNRSWDNQDTTNEADAVSEPRVTDADLAVMGIAVPASDSVDGTEEAVATLVETAAEKANAETVPPWGS